MGCKRGREFYGTGTSRFDHLMFRTQLIFDLDMRLRSLDPTLSRATCRAILESSIYNIYGNIRYFRYQQQKHPFQQEIGR
jgi:hypothetical protein